MIKYEAVLDTDLTLRADTLRECKAWAEAHGTEAKRCTVYKRGKAVALYVRDTNGRGLRWFRAYL